MFTSTAFIFAFLPAVLYGVTLCRRMGRDAVVVWLLVASLVFYAAIDLSHLPLLAVSIFVNFVISKRIASAGQPEQRRLFLVAGIAWNLSILALFKYADFIISSLVVPLAGNDVQSLRISLPVGISFYTFTQVAFLIDHYRSAATPGAPQRYALFVSYFPHLVAGPVLYHGQVLPQFEDKRFGAFLAKDLVFGSMLFVTGLAKKLLIADGLAPIADGVFTTAHLGAVMTFWEAWIGLLAYSLQIYFDFSGYSDMAIGLSCILGVTIPANFNSPYRATSIVDFWRRWHISLSSFLRDYLYIPLGGNRRGPLRRYVNVLTTMAIGGVWHGAGWGFLVWGLIHGTALVCNQIYRDWRPPPAVPASALNALTLRLAGWLLTMLVVMQSWAFFRAENVSSAWTLLMTAWGVNGIGLPRTFEADVVRWNDQLGYQIFNADGGFLSGTVSTYFTERTMLAVALFIALTLPNSQSALGYVSRWLWPSRSPLAKFAVALLAVVFGIVFGLCLIRLERNSPFIYGNF